MSEKPTMETDAEYRAHYAEHEHNRALCKRLERERDETKEALRELYEARRAPYPSYECGPDAQLAWSDRINAADARARAILDAKP